MTPPNSVAEFIGEVTYDLGTGMLLTEHNQLLANLKTWPRIANLFREAPALGEKFQDELGLWIASAINEKIARDNNSPELF